MLVMDVDGTLTDGKIYMSASGELMKAFNIKDGYAIAHLKESNIIPVIITARLSDIVKQRCKEINIQEFYQGVANKVFQLRRVCEKYQVDFVNVAYIGDDINDLPCMQLCGLSACPSDAVKEVKEQADYISSYKGGEGAVRDLVDYIASQQNKQSELKDFSCQEVKYELDPYIND